MGEHDDILSDAGREALALVSAPPPQLPLVLVVDDDILSRRALAWYLNRKGIRCISASSALAALRALRREPRIGMMITDLRMGPVDGLELIKQIRSSVRADLPIVVVSGESQVPEAVKAMHLGVLDFMVKPPDLDKLLRLVRKELRIE